MTAISWFIPNATLFTMAGQVLLLANIGCIVNRIDATNHWWGESSSQKTRPLVLGQVCVPMSKIPLTLCVHKSRSRLPVVGLRPSKTFACS